MVWKVFEIESGKIIKAGFANEDQASRWLLKKTSLAHGDFEVEEMDDDEWDEYQESSDEDEEASEAPVSESIDSSEDLELSYVDGDELSTDDLDGGDLEDDLLAELDGED